MIEVLKQKFPRDYYSVKSSNYELSDNQIVLHLKNDNVRKSVEARLSILNRQAQLVLNNKNVKFVFEIEEKTEKSKSLYSTSDKIRHYKEKNNNVNRLIELFNLNL